jgi:modulator of FtsH protease
MNRSDREPRAIAATWDDAPLRPAPVGSGSGGVSPLIASHRVLRNTYALLGLTLLFSAGVAGAGMVANWPAPGLLLTLAGYFGLLFLTYKTSRSAWGLLSVFALTGFMGYTLGPILDRVAALPDGSQVITLALGSTAVTFLALSAWALASRRDFSVMGGMLFAGMVVAVLGGLAAAFFDIPALGLAISAMVVLLSSGLILYETSRIVHGGETNYILATVGLYVSVFNLFTSLLSLFGVSSANE